MIRHYRSPPLHGLLTRHVPASVPMFGLLGILSARQGNKSNEVENTRKLEIKAVLVCIMLKKLGITLFSYYNVILNFNSFML